jgi:hypothetical protein
VATVAPSRASAITQMATPAAIIALSITVGFLFMRVDELSKEVTRLDQGRLTIARAAAEALASQSQATDRAASRARSAPRRIPPADGARPAEQSAEAASDEEEARLVETTPTSEE